MPPKVEIGLKITDNIDNELYILSGINETAVTLEHLPKGRHTKKDDWILIWDRFIELFKEKQLSVENFDEHLEVFEIACNKEMQRISFQKEITEKSDLTEKQKIEIEKYQYYHDKVENARLERRKRVKEQVTDRFNKRQVIKDEMNKLEKTRQIQSHLDLYKELSESHPDENTRKQYTIKYEMLIASIKS